MHTDRAITKSLRVCFFFFFAFKAFTDKMENRLFRNRRETIIFPLVCFLSPLAAPFSYFTVARYNLLESKTLTFFQFSCILSCNKMISYKVLISVSFPAAEDSVFVRSSHWDFFGLRNFFFFPL